jgi:hypothetical protein
MKKQNQSYEIVFSRRCVPPSRIIKADRYEIQPPNGITNVEDEIVFYRGDFVVDRESVYDVKEIRVVEQAAK